MISLRSRGAMGKTRAENSLPASCSSSAGSCRRWRKSSYATRARWRSTTSPSCQAPPIFMAKRLRAAPGGRAMRNRPSIRCSRGFSKVRCNSVKARGGSSTPFASRATRDKPVPSDAVRRIGAAGSAADPSSAAFGNWNEAGTTPAAAGRETPDAERTPPPATTPTAARPSKPKRMAVRDMEASSPSDLGGPDLGTSQTS